MGLASSGFYDKEVDIVVKGDESLTGEMGRILRSALVNAGAVSAPTAQEREWLAYAQIKTDDERIIKGKAVYELYYASTWLNRIMGEREELTHGMLWRPVTDAMEDAFSEMAEELCDQAELKIMELQGIRTGE